MWFQQSDAFTLVQFRLKNYLNLLRFADIRGIIHSTTYFNTLCCLPFAVHMFAVCIFSIFNL